MLLYRKSHLTPLRRIDAEPRRVILSQRGFPPDFQVEDFDVYLYSNGREIPTNCSEKQIALTRDEARTNDGPAFKGVKAQSSH